MRQRILSVIALTFLCTQSCADDEAADAGMQANNTLPAEVSLDDLAPNAKDYDSKVVTVHGYFVHSPGSLMLLAHETSEFYSEPSVLIHDSILEEKIIKEAKFIDQSDYMLSIGCDLPLRFSSP